MRSASSPCNGWPFTATGCARLGAERARSLASALDDLEAAGVSIYADKEAVDASTAHGRAMLEMAAVFAKLERSMIRERVMAGLARARAQKTPLGRPRVSAMVESSILAALKTGKGIGKVARELGVGVSTVQRVRKAMVTAPSAAT